MGNYSLVLEESAQNLLPARAISPEGQGSWGVPYINPQKSLFEGYELFPRHFWPATHVGRAGSGGQRKPAGKRFRWWSWQLEGPACTETEGATGTQVRLWGSLLYCQVQYFYLLFDPQLNEEDSKASEEGRTTGPKEPGFWHYPLEGCSLARNTQLDFSLARNKQSYQATKIWRLFVTAVSLPWLTQKESRYLCSKPCTWLKSWDQWMADDAANHFLAHKNLWDAKWKALETPKAWQAGWPEKEPLEYAQKEARVQKCRGVLSFILWPQCYSLLSKRTDLIKSSSHLGATDPSKTAE